MSKVYRVLVVASVLGTLNSASAIADDVSLQVQLSGLRNVKGQVVCDVYNSEEGYDDGQSLHRVTSRLDTTETLMLVFPVLTAPAQVGVVCFHDEDGNGRMKTNFIGMPTEGVGVSGTPSGIPSFGKIKFDLQPPEQVVSIALRYL